MIVAPRNLNEYSEFVMTNLNKQIIFEEGRYSFAGQLAINGVDQLNIMGRGPLLTTLAGFSLSVSTGQDWNNLGLSIGGVRIDGKVELSDCCYVIMRDVWFVGDGQLVLRGVWDSVFEGIHHHYSNGMEINERQGKMQGNPGGGSSNCVTIRGGRFEGCKGTPLTVANSRKIFIDGVKFHGIYPNPLPFDHLVMDRVTNSMVTNCNFTACGKSFVNIRNCNGLQFSNVMDDPRAFAFDVDSRKGIQVGGLIAARKVWSK